MEEYKEWKTQKGVFCNEITKWSKWKIHKKDTKNREWKEEKKNNQETEKKKEDPPKKRSKKRYSFQRRRRRKNKRYKNWIRKKCETQLNIKNIFENHEFFFKSIAKNDETFQKRRFFLVQEAEKTKKWRCKKRPKKFKKEEEIKNTCTQKEGKMEQEKTCVQKRKSEENKLKKGKEKGRWKTEVFKKKIKGEDKPEERNKKRTRWRKKRGL